MVHVPLIARMLDRAIEVQPAEVPHETTVITAGFARDPSHFPLQGPDRRLPGIGPERKRPADGISGAGFRGGAV